MKKTLAAVIIIFLALSFHGCTSCSDKSATKKLKKSEDEQVGKIAKEIEKNVYPLPTSADVIKKLTELEVGFMIGISNPAENVKKYFTSATRSINLGVYGADLSYATLYNYQSEVNTYMETIRGLANELNMSKIYNAALYDSIKKNFDNRERLVQILSDAFDDTYAYMSDNDQQTLALLVVGGAWVEGMFLTCNVSEAAYQNAAFSGVLLEQKASFELYLELTKPYMEDLSVKEFVEKLEPIKKVYAGLGTSLTMENIMAITTAIKTVRGKII
jgi:hypothetical protein